MKLFINPFDVTFTDCESVEFTVNGLQFGGECYEAPPVGNLNFVPYLHETTAEAGKFYSQFWEDINEQLTYIYYNRPSQPEIDGGNLTEKYKGYTVRYDVLTEYENFSPVYFAGFDVISPDGFSFGQLFDSHGEALQAIDEHLLSSL